MRNHFLKHICEKRLTGVGYAVCINGEEKCREILGFSDCVQQRPLPSDAIFRLASMTKPITAIAVMICKERGLLDLDTPISTYIDFAHGGVGEVKDGETVFKESAREITLRDILTHSSGLGSGNVGSAQTKEKKQPEKLEKNVAWWKGKLLDFAPGSHAAYSGVVAFEVAAFVVEKVSGKPFDVFLKENIFEPLQMKDTCYILNEEQASRLVEMPFPDNKGNIQKIDLGLRGFDSFALGYTGGSAGLFSTLDDYLALANMLASGGEWRGKRILKEDSVREISRAQFCVNEWFAWGLGVYTRMAKNEKQPLPVGSFGWSGAFGTHFWVDPSRKLAAVLMLNHGNCGGSDSPFSAEFEKLVEEALWQ